MRREREELIARIHRECPHHVDVIPPQAGYSPAIVDAIWEFLDERIGAVDIYELVENGQMFTR